MTLHPFALGLSKGTPVHPFTLSLPKGTPASDPTCPDPAAAPRPTGLDTLHPTPPKPQR